MAKIGTLGLTESTDITILLKINGVAALIRVCRNLIKDIEINQLLTFNCEPSMTSIRVKIVFLNHFASHKYSIDEYIIYRIIQMTNNQSNQQVTEVSQWKYKDGYDFEVPDGSIGFLYKITHSSGKFYYGRKLLTKAATKQINGKKKKIRADSDWKNYWSSSPIIKDWIEREGIDNFQREILIFVSTKASMIYGEEYILYVTGSLFNPHCLNENIRAKIYRKWFTKTPQLHNQLCELFKSSFSSP